MRLSTTAASVPRPVRAGANIALALAAGYSLALVGSIWDDLEHAGNLGLGPGFAHLTIYLGFAVLLGALIALFRTGTGWLSRDGTPSIGRLAAAAGIAVLLAGIIVDLVWHGMNPDASEENMLRLPGHAIQHAGIIIGLFGSSITLVQPSRRAITLRPTAKTTAAPR